MHLTAVSIDKLKHKPARWEVTDDASLPLKTGLRLLLQPAPSKTKSWVCRIVRPDGKSSKVTLGGYAAQAVTDEPTVGSPLTLAQARSLALRLKHERANGQDVAEEAVAAKRQRRLKAAGQGDGFADVARAFVENHKVRKTGQRPSNWREVARLLGWRYPTDDGEPQIIPGSLAERWRDRPVGAITGLDCHHAITEAVKVGVPGIAPTNPGPSDSRGRHLANALGGMFRWAMRHRRALMQNGNVMQGEYRPAPPQARERTLNRDEIRLLWRALDDDGIGYPYPAITRMLLLTACRLNEIAQLEWKELDADLTRIDLPGARTKNRLPHVVPISPQAREVLRTAKRVERCELVFTSGTKTVTAWDRAKTRIDAAIAKANGGKPIPHWTFHDLRRTCATLMSEDLKIPPHIVESCLNHQSGARAGVAGIYNRALHLDERRIALERWAQHVEGIVTGRPGNVVVLRSA